MNDPYRQNSFAILKLPPTATNAEIKEKAEEMEALIEAGELTGITRPQVIQAQRQLLHIQQRILEELFCSSFEANEWARLRKFTETWSKDPLNPELDLALIQEEWTADQFQADFSGLPEPETELTAEIPKFDREPPSSDISLALKKLPFPEFPLAEE